MNHSQNFSVPSYQSRTLPMLEGWLRTTGTWREYKNMILHKDRKTEKTYAKKVAEI